MKWLEASFRWVATLAIISLLISAIRLFGWIYLFNECSIYDWTQGFIFDLATSAFITLLLWITRHILPLKAWAASTFLILFICTGLTTGSILYFPFSRQHITIATITAILEEKLPKWLITYILQYLWASIPSLLATLLTEWIIINLIKQLNRIQNLLAGIILLPLSLLFWRGPGYRPLHSSDASRFASAPECSSSLLNGFYTALRTIDSKVINWHIPDTPPCTGWTPLYTPPPNPPIKTKPNIILLVVEGLSAEFTEAGGALHTYSTHITPTIDSLWKDTSITLFKSLIYTNAHRTMDGIPALLSGIPAILPVSYIYSPYLSSSHFSIPRMLSALGYSTAFIHGGHRNSQGLDACVKSAGIQYSFFMEDYPEPELHSDGVWGIYDHLMLKWAISIIDTLPQPFFVTILTLSSHPPYKIPDSLRTLLNIQDNEILTSFRYADWSIGTFIRELSTRTYWNNTLLIITADHPHPPLHKTYSTNTPLPDNLIPLILLSPSLHKNQIDTLFDPSFPIQQIDLLPTLASLLGYNHSFIAFGNSLLTSRNCRAPAVIPGENIFHFIDSSGVWSINTAMSGYCYSGTCTTALKLKAVDFLIFFKAYMENRIEFIQYWIKTCQISCRAQNTSL